MTIHANRHCAISGSKAYTITKNSSCAMFAYNAYVVIAESNCAIHKDISVQNPWKWSICNIIWQSLSLFSAKVSPLGWIFPIFTFVRTCFHRCLFHFHDCRFFLLVLSQVLLFLSLHFSMCRFNSLYHLQGSFSLFLTIANVAFNRLHYYMCCIIAQH